MKSMRTEKIEKVAEEQTDNLEEYPNSPYTKRKAEDLEITLRCLKLSVEIDKMGD